MIASAGSEERAGGGVTFERSVAEPMTLTTFS
jgi:hypothetical protein